jgi:transposase
LRSGALWRDDLPINFGPYTTCYNRFVRWRRAGVWAKIMNALAGAHDAAVQMIDTSISPPAPLAFRPVIRRAAERFGSFVLHDSSPMGHINYRGSPGEALSGSDA